MSIVRQRRQAFSKGDAVGRLAHGKSAAAPDVAVVVVEYFCVRELAECITSCEGCLKGGMWEGVVVSNSGYGPEVRDELVRRWPQWKWIFNDRNYGFARAVNQGVRGSSARLVLLLNPDARIVAADFRAVIEYFRREASAGILGPRIRGANGEARESYRRFVTPVSLIGRVAGRVNGVVDRGGGGDAGAADEPCDVDWVPGSSMIVRRAAIERVGAMDEKYFLYVEDMDWCWRFRMAGWRVVYWPGITVEHDGRRQSSKALANLTVSRYVTYHALGLLRFWSKRAMAWLGRAARHGGKRTLDIVFALTMGLAAGPVGVAIALGIKLEDRGPVFYVQERVGRSGRMFRSVKFRSMRAGSESESMPRQAVERDPRVTRVGRWLRVSALDEIPQLWNIIRGDMSVVGPRALLRAEVEACGGTEAIPLEDIPGYERRHSVRPGLTGLAQIYAPRDVPRRQKFRYDLLYIRKQSLWLDLKLIMLSFWISLRGKWESRQRKF